MILKQILRSHVFLFPYPPVITSSFQWKGWLSSGKSSLPVAPLSATGRRKFLDTRVPTLRRAGKGTTSRLATDFFSAWWFFAKRGRNPQGKKKMNDVPKNWGRVSTYLAIFALYKSYFLLNTVYSNWNAFLAHQLRWNLGTRQNPWKYWKCHPPVGTHSKRKKNQLPYPDPRTFISMYTYAS